MRACGLPTRHPVPQLASWLLAPWLPVAGGWLAGVVLSQPASGASQPASRLVAGAARDSIMSGTGRSSTLS